MSRKLPGSAIVPGTITVTQITGGLNDTTNASYAQANTARTTANDAYGQANTARDQANTARTQANTAYGQANNAYSSANLAYDQANASYNVANTKLASAGGTLSGDLIITGNLTVSGNSTTLNTEVLTVEDAEVVLLSNVASTPALNAGVIVNRGTSANTFLRWDEALDEWGWSDSGNTTYYFEDLRAGLATTNTTFGTVNTSLGTINTSYQAAYAQANTAGTNALNAYGQANAAYAQANSAYGAANNRVLKAGDTMTGNLTLSAASLVLSSTSNDQRLIDAEGISATGRHVAFPLRFMIGSASVGYPFAGYNAIPRANGAYSYSGSDTAWGISYGNGSRMGFYYAASGTAGANISFSELMTITSGGSVGIANTAPLNKLQIGSGGTSGYSGNDLVIGNGTQVMAFYQSATESAWYTNTRFALMPSGAGATGNVGIGTTTPAHKLDVNGTSIFRDTLNFGSGALISWTTGYSDGTTQTFNSPSSGSLAFATNSSLAMFIKSNQNIGIGTANPDYKLTINSTQNALKIITTSATSGSPSIDLIDNGVDVVIAAAGGSSTGLIGTWSSHAFSIYTSNSPRLTLTAAGNVGIGTTSPFSKLQVGSHTFSGGNGVFADSRAGITLHGSLTSIMYASTYNDSTYPDYGLVFVHGANTSNYNVWSLSPDGPAKGNSLNFIYGSNASNIHTGTPKVVFRGDGNVGIGTTNPGYRLTVSGDVQAINGQVLLTQNYGITWNNGDNYIKGVGGYHVDITTYDGSSAQQDGIRVVGGTSKSARLIAYGGVRYGRALQSTAANKVIRGWHNYTTSGSSSGTIYVHFKTNMWAGGSPSGNIQYTMSLFRATGYSYNAHTIDSLIGFHNWSGSHYNIKITDLGSKAFWSTVYTSADGYTVLVGNLTNYNYDAVSIDWFQTYEYPFVDAWVTAQSTSANLTGVY